MLHGVAKQKTKKRKHLGPGSVRLGSDPSSPASSALWPSLAEPLRKPRRRPSDAEGVVRVPGLRCAARGTGECHQPLRTCTTLARRDAEAGFSA